MYKLVKIQGKTKRLSLSIDSESVNVYIDNGATKEPLQVCYWHIDEVIEDGEVAVPMINAVHLYHTNPQELIDRLKL
jgi:hypothetical protein